MNQSDLGTVNATSSGDASSIVARVLVIDDDVSTLEGFSGVLRTAGFSVETAESGHRGMHLALLGRFDVILADLHVPDVSGLEVLQAVRQAHVDSAFVVVTGFGSTAIAVEAMRAGATDFVEKPLIGDELIDVIERAFCGRDRRRAAPPNSHVTHVTAHAAARWASRLIVPVIGSSRDLRTLLEWGRYVAVSPGALKNWCRTANVNSKRSLLLSRLLRALVLYHSNGLRPEDSLDLVDKRTLAKVLAMGGLSRGKASVHFGSLEEFLRAQCLVTDARALEELRFALAGRIGPPGDASASDAPPDLGVGGGPAIAEAAK
jgi:FixJ family two-component response regulator